MKTRRGMEGDGRNDESRNYLIITPPPRSLEIEVEGSSTQDKPPEGGALRRACRDVLPSVFFPPFQ